MVYPEFENKTPTSWGNCLENVIKIKLMALKKCKSNIWCLQVNYLSFIIHVSLFLSMFLNESLLYVLLKYPDFINWYCWKLCHLICFKLLANQTFCWHIYDNIATLCSFTASTTFNPRLLIFNHLKKRIESYFFCLSNYFILNKLESLKKDFCHNVTELTLKC